MSRRVHGGVKFYRGAPGAARSYVEAGRSRADDYYLAEGTGLASRYVAERAAPAAPGDARAASPVVVTRAAELDSDSYEQWVAGHDVGTGEPKGRLRTDAQGLRFVEVVVNGPKTWSLAAALHPAIAEAYDAAQDRAAGEIVGWVAEHATTRVGPRGRQVQVPVDQVEAAVVRHHTSRAGDPHRHLHLQVNARVQAGGRWRGLHSVGIVDSIEALNGIGHAAAMCDPELRTTLAAHGYSLDPATGEVCELAPYADAFSARASQINRNVDRYEAAWRREHPDREPGPKLRRAWDRRAWAEARPDKVVPRDGTDLATRWVEELHDLGFTTPSEPATLLPTTIGRLNRDAVTEVVTSRLGARRSSWNAADIRGEVERVLASVDIVTAPAVRRELAEDLTARTIAACRPLLDRLDVPEHVRALTSATVLDVEADLVDRLAARSLSPGQLAPALRLAPATKLDDTQRAVAARLAGTARLVVVEGAAGTGKTTTLRATRDLVEDQDARLVVVTPTLKAARVAADQLGTAAFSAAHLAHQHGFRWDDDGRWTRDDTRPTGPGRLDRLLSGDLLLIDEAGMLDQDTTLALLTIADEADARIAFVGDRHQLPAVGRGGVLDHAHRWAAEENQLVLEAVHRFSDTTYADLTLAMRTGEDPGAVFDVLLERGAVVFHRSEVERLTAVADLAAASPADLVIADTRDQVADLNAQIRDHRLPATARPADHGQVGHEPAVGDRVTTRRNDRALDVANRDQWTVTGRHDNGDLTVTGRRGHRTLPATYAAAHVELCYATTVHGAQGETVDNAHFLLGETTGAASTYVAMTRGRHRNTAHLVADSTDAARAQWIDTFTRGRADLGPAHARQAALDAIDQYGPQYDSAAHPAPPPRSDRSPRREHRATPSPTPGQDRQASSAPGPSR